MKLQKQKVAETKRQKVNPKAIMKSYSDKLQGELEVKGVDFFTPTDIDPHFEGSANIKWIVSCQKAEEKSLEMLDYSEFLKSCQNGLISW